MLKVLLLVAAAIVPLVCAPVVHAEQGYGRFDLAVQSAPIKTGDEFAVDIYITGLQGSPFGKAAVSVESWYAADPNPKGYEFVRFESAGSPFTINLGQNIHTGYANYQCRQIVRQAPTDVTGKQLFGRVIYKALNPGNFAVAIPEPCNTVIESLTGNWSFVWDNSYAYFTISSPLTPSTPVASSTNSAVSGTRNASASDVAATDQPKSNPNDHAKQSQSSKPGSTNNAAGSNSVATSVPAQNGQANPEAVASPTKAVSSLNGKQVAVHRNNMVWVWITLAALTVIIIPAVIWRQAIRRYIHN